MSAETYKGNSIFLDVFRRADKNDDGALSWDEFRAFFADGVLSNDELDNLFHEIDTHNTNNIDVGELKTYFSKHLGSFQDIFAAVEDLNESVTKALGSTAEQYPKSSFVEQFVSRFLMREILNQLSALERPLEAASDHLERKALEESPCTQSEGRLDKQQATLADDTKNKAEVEAPLEGQLHDPSTIVPGRFGRRAMRQISSQTSYTADAGGYVGLQQQVDRLRDLVSSLENKVNFAGIQEEQVNIENEELMLIVHRKLQVSEEHDKAFRKALRDYVESTNVADGNLHLSIRTYAGSNVFSLYEIWDSHDSWKNYLRSSASKTFQHKNIDYMEIPEQVGTLHVPAAWWNRD